MASHTRVDEPSPSQTDLLPDRRARRRVGPCTRGARARSRALSAAGTARAGRRDRLDRRSAAPLEPGRAQHRGGGRRRRRARPGRVDGRGRAGRRRRGAGHRDGARVGQGFHGAGHTRLRLEVRRPVTVENALDAGRTGSFPLAVWHWAKGFFSPQRASGRGRRRPRPRPTWPRSTATTARGRQPVEPSIAVEGRAHRRGARPTPDAGVDSDAIVAAMPDAATRGLPLEVTVGRTCGAPALHARGRRTRRRRG